MMRRVMCVVSLALVAASASAQQSPQSPMARKFAPDSAWQRIWLLGADSTADRFVEPRQITVTGDLVVVLDLGTREVTGVEARTGKARFLLRPRGEGPGEFKRPARLVATPTGFAIIDHHTARITAYDRSANPQWDALIPDVFDIDGLCVRRGPRIVTKLQRRDSAIVEYDTTGRRTAIRSVPWKTIPPGGVAFAHAGYMSDASPSGDCVVAPIFGGEWGVATATGAIRTFALREPGPNAEVKVAERTLDKSLTNITVQSVQQSDTKHASRGAMIRGDTAIIYAADTKASPMRLLDYYDVRTGAYLYSRKLPFVVMSLAVGDDGTFYATRISADASAVVAIRPERPKSREIPR